MSILRGCLSAGDMRFDERSQVATTGRAASPTTTGVITALADADTTIRQAVPSVAMLRRKPSARGAGERSRGEVRTDLLATARRYWWRLLVLAGPIFGLVVIVQLLPFGSWWRGFNVGVLITMLIAGGLWLVVEETQGAFMMMQGAAAEDLTSSVFTRWRRSRAGWHIEHGIVVSDHEIDHVAVGPGGVLAIETKWVGGIKKWSLTSAGLVGPIGRDPIAQARTSATKVSGLLRAVSPGPRIDGVPVEAVLVLWGPGSPRPSAPVTIDGVTVVRGGDRGHWAAVMTRSELHEELATLVHRKVHDFAVAQSQARQAGSSSR